MNILAALAARIGSKALLWAGAVIVGLGVISGLYLSVKRCGRMDCLTPDSLNVDSEELWRTFPGRIDKVEVRVDGICKNCMK